MGNTCTSACQPVEESPILESVGVNQVELKQTYDDVQGAVVAAAGYVEEAVAEDVTAKVEGIKESVEKTAEEIVAAENGSDSPVAAVIEQTEANKASEKAPEKAEEEAEEKAEQKVEEKPAEKLGGTECKAPCAPLILVLEMNGSRKTVEFTFKPLGFEYSQPKTCCVPAKGKPPVRVTRVTVKQQAATLGVERGATICQVNGKDIADPIQLRDLLAEALATLPEAEASN